MPAELLDGTLAALAARVGIAARYTDTTGTERVTGADTARAILAAMGFDASTPARAAEAVTQLDAGRRTLPQWLVLDVDRPASPQGIEGRPWSLTLEDGSASEGRGAPLPPLPLGLHRLTVAHESVTLLVAPSRLPLPPRGWGLTAPLWGLRGPEGTGFGDYADLARTAAGLAGTGAAFLGINPVHAGFPTAPAMVSPYTPSHRGRWNVAHIATGEGEPVPLRDGLVDYAAAIPARLQALREAQGRFVGDAAFDAWQREQGTPLKRFCRHQALSERYGPFWTDWPSAERCADTASVDPAGERFHAWCQWEAERQLAHAAEAARSAGLRHGLYLDLAVGTHPAGAETWVEPHLFARGVSLGAPPDGFAPDGQTWGLAPLDPRAMVADGFAHFAATLRANLRFAGMLRIDHVLGFERAFWVPEEAGVPGAYVAMPRDAMLAVARIEAARAGAVIVGEDLGNIPAGLRRALAASGLLGCRVMQFEADPKRGATAAADYAEATLASFATHDLPTWLGWRRGRDIAWRERVDGMDAATAKAALAHREAETAALDRRLDGTGPDAMHAFLARTGSALVAVQAEDVLGCVEQANLPGTVDTHPNWRRVLPVAGADLGADPRLRATARIMDEAGRGAAR